MMANPLDVCLALALIRIAGPAIRPVATCG